MKSTFHKCQMCGVFFDVDEHPARLYCNRCRLIRDRDRKKVEVTKLCGICGKELVTTMVQQLHHKECVLKRQREKALEYKRNKK